MFSMNNIREVPVIEVFVDNKWIGTFINMNTINHVLPKNRLYTTKHSKINENHKHFWKLIRKGYVMNIPELSKEDERKMLGLDLKDPDAIVAYIESFYKNNNVKSEKDLVEKLSEHKPLRTAIELQEHLR